MQGDVKGYGKQCQVPPEAQGGGRKVSDRDARGLQSTQGSKNTVTDGCETREKQGQRWRVFIKLNIFRLKAIHWSFVVRLSDSMGGAFFLKND